MMLLVFLALILIAVVVRLGVPVVRRRRFALELRRDQWPRFEREFRIYASRSWRAARDAERRG